MIDPRQVAVRLLGPVDWQSEVSGFCRCPGEKMHTSPNGKRKIAGAGERQYLPSWTRHVVTSQCLRAFFEALPVTRAVTTHHRGNKPKV